MWGLRRDKGIRKTSKLSTVSYVYTYEIIQKDFPHGWFQDFPVRIGQILRTLGVSHKFSHGTLSFQAFCTVSYGALWRKTLYHWLLPLCGKGWQCFSLVFYVYTSCITPHEALWNKGWQSFSMKKFENGADTNLGLCPPRIPQRLRHWWGFSHPCHPKRERERLPPPKNHIKKYLLTFSQGKTPSSHAPQGFTPSPKMWLYMYIVTFCRGKRSFFPMFCHIIHLESP